MKKIGTFLIVTFVLYVGCLYLVSDRETFLVPENYEGPLLIIAKQKDGLVVNEENTIYDFTKSNVIRIKKPLSTNLFPWGYLNYYSVDKNGKKKKIEEIHNESVEKQGLSDGIYIWDYYFEIGSCNDVPYEVLVVASKNNINRIINEAEILVDTLVCRQQNSK